MSMVGMEERSLRSHEERALELYTAPGNEAGMAMAHQALVLATFLAEEYDEAARLETANLEAFRRRGSEHQVADSLTLLSAVSWRQGDAAAAWGRVCEGLRLFVEVDSASGLARVIGMASIILLADGDGEFGARLAGATYRLVREKGVMLAPVKVLHLPDPAGPRHGSPRCRARGRAAGRGRRDGARGRRGGRGGRAGAGSGARGHQGDLRRVQLLGLLAADARHDLQAAAEPRVLGELDDRAGGAVDRVGHRVDEHGDVALEQDARRTSGTARAW